MSAVLCGKRSNIFEESPSSPPVSKRICCYSSSSSSSPARVAAASCWWFSDSSAALDHLVSLFPDMDREFLEKALQESGDDLELAIKRLYDLQLNAAEGVSDASQEIDSQFSAEGPVANNEGTAPGEESSGGSNFPGNGAEWVELLVGEVTHASDIEDAKARVSRALEALEKSICANATAVAAQSFQKENILLTEQVEMLILDNAILKRAVSIQHERQKEIEEMGQELHKLKQLISQYQEQVRNLEVQNYTLAMHLKQAQQSSSISGRFHPDVF